MTGTFACPECGNEVTLQGATPGRHVRCAGCETWVEVPFLPRDGVWTRPKFRKRRPSWVLPVAWAGVGLFAIVVAIVAAGTYAQSQRRAAFKSMLGEFLVAVDQAEKGGKIGRALSEIEGAIALVRSREPIDADRLKELSRRRDRLSVREAEARIAASVTLEPSTAVGDLLGLQARARKDRALDGLTSIILSALESARKRQVEVDLAGARLARDQGRVFDALTLCEKALIASDKLDASSGRAAAAEAEAIMGPIVARIGAIVVQIPGRYALGSVHAYDSTLGARLADGLREQGYAPQPLGGPIAPIWDRHATVRMEYQIAESQNALYLQSKSRTSEIAARLGLIRRGKTDWQTHVTARTQVPLPDLPAYIGGRLAISDKPNPETERRLYENARLGLLDQIGLAVRGLPPP